MNALAIVALSVLVLYLITTMWRVLLLGIAAITIAVVAMGIQDFFQMLNR